MTINWLIIAAIPVILVTFWLTILALLSYVSGWRKLAAGYTCKEPFIGTTWRFQSAEMRWLGIRNCLILGADARGLYMSMMLLFRFWHPPLLIPWTAINSRTKKKLFSEGVEFTLGPAPGVPLWVWPPIADKIRAAAGPAFPG